MEFTKVRLSYNGDERYAKNIPITVEGWGEVHRVTLDQSKPAEIAGLFQPIGRFKFEKGGRVNVIIETTGTEGYVICDAIQFVKTDDIEREAEALAAAEKEGGAGNMMLYRMNEGDLKKELKKLLEELRKAEVAMTPRDASDAGDINLRVRGAVGRLVPW